MAAICLFALGAGLVMHAPWREGVTVYVPTVEEPPSYDAYAREAPMMRRLWLKRLWHFDQRFSVWVIARNARALLHDPLHVFEAETCHPVRRSLALGNPALTSGLLGLPAYLATGDPVATFNFALVAMLLASAMAMWLLVTDWTDSATAGVVAALLFAFSPVRLHDVATPFLTDVSWTLLCLFFARRLLSAPRWRDAIGCALCAILQSGVTLYPLVAGALVGLPLTAAMAWGFGWRSLRAAPPWLAALLATAGVLLLFAPYLSMRSGDLAERTLQQFAPLGAFLPGGLFFPGWAALALGALAFVPGLRSAPVRTGADLRPWILVTVALVVLVATGGGSATPERTRAFWLDEPVPPPPEGLGPSVYGLVAALIPGFSFVRAPGWVAIGVPVLASLLAGFGVAALLQRLTTERARVAGPLTIAGVFALAVGPVALGLDPGLRYGVHRMRPPEAVLRFFDELAERGDDGPLLELPADRLEVRSASALLTSYHHRRSSACFTAHEPPEALRVRELSRRVPDEDALRELAEMGFRTLLVHHPEGQTLVRARARAIGAAATRDPDGPLQPLASSDEISAWTIRPPATSGP